MALPLFHVRIFLAAWLALATPLSALAETGRADACATYYAKIGEPLVVAEEKEGPRVILKADPKSGKTEDMHELKVMFHNTFNLSNPEGKFAVDKATGALKAIKGVERKMEWEFKAEAAMILENKPDVLFAEEIGGMESLHRYNTKYLDNAYRPVLISGNDERGIDIGLLIRRETPLDAEMVSHANRTFTNAKTGKVEEVFSRDVPVVLFRRKGAAPDERPLFAMFGNHLKSQRDGMAGKLVVDPRSVYKRTEQVKEVMKIKDELLQKFPGLPVIMGGDFNSDIRTGAEFQPFWRSGMQDAFAARKIPEAERYTHFFFPKGQPPSQSQLDAIIMNKEATGFLKDARIIRYKDAKGGLLRTPTSYDDLHGIYPSDHLPVFGTFDFDGIRKAAGLSH